VSRTVRCMTVYATPGAPNFSMLRIFRSKAHKLAHWSFDECARQVALSVPLASHGLLISEHMQGIKATMAVCQKCFDKGKGVSS
jgi:hypothetical protein